MQIVRNEWQEAPAVSSDSTQRIIKLQSSSINTYDNPDYFPPNGIPITKDDQGRTVKESSLRLNFIDIRPGEQALVRDFLIGQTINIASYQTMSMWVHGDNGSYGPDTRFFFRFGSNDSTYYEYSSPINQGWFPMNINLHDLSKFKQNLTNDSIPVSMDTIQNSFGLKYRNKSPPSFSSISWMAMGIIRSKSTTNSIDGITGELWVDELKVGGVHQFNGWAGRASLTTSWAGFMNLGGSINYRDGDFQQMTETDMKLGTTTLSEDFSASLALGRFLPTQWGVNIPIGTSVNTSITRPSLVPNTDEYLTDYKSKPDDITDMYRDAINLIAGHKLIAGNESEAKHFQTTNVTKSYYTSYDKGSTSKNPIVNLLLERLSLDCNRRIVFRKAQREKCPPKATAIISTTLLPKAITAA